MSNRQFEETVANASTIIVITENDGGELHLSFSENLSELEALDMLTTACSRFYNIASEDDANTFH